MRMAQENWAHEKTEFLKRTPARRILTVVAAGPVPGCAISQRIQPISKDFFQPPQGSLYATLHPLEEYRWLEAEWNDAATRGEAKFYKPTRAGRKQLDAEVLHGKRLSDAVSLVLRTAPQG